MDNTRALSRALGRLNLKYFVNYEYFEKAISVRNNDGTEGPQLPGLVIDWLSTGSLGDYLIDDRGKNGTSEFKGEWIQFGSERFPDWDAVVEYLLNGV